MQEITSKGSPFRVTERDGIVYVENEYVSWGHDPARGGEICSAAVKYGSGKNLLVNPQYTELAYYIPKGWCTYHSYRTVQSAAEDFKTEEKDGMVRVSFHSRLTDEKGEELDGVTVSHEAEYHIYGSVFHKVTLHLTKEMAPSLVTVGALDIINTMNMQCVCPSSYTSPALEYHPGQWIPLAKGKTRSDLPAYTSRFLPLKMTIFQSGMEGMEMALGDDLSAWTIGTDKQGFSRGAIYEIPSKQAYHVVFSPLEALKTENMPLKAGDYTFTYELALPYVKKHIQPLMIASGLLRGGGFENRWPDYDYLKELKEYGVSMLRLHNDGGRKDGIFWRDADYPPYPPEEMAKMDRCLADAEKAGICVVPYFSVKEYHPDAPGFEQYAEKCARQVLPNHKWIANAWDDFIFGMQMCLESDWYKVRKESIEKPLDNHAFHGLYYDWTGGMECINPAHNHGKRHWDYDKLIELLEWSREKAGADGKIYLHLTNAPCFSGENLADLVLTEESEYSEIFPEMFTPHVHFMNINARSICVMLPHAAREQIQALTLAALLHHATICGTDKAALEIYRKYENLFRKCCNYEHHSAPGEGVTDTDGSRAVGMSLYWNNDPAQEALGVFANLTNQPQFCRWSVKLNGKSVYGTAEVPPLELLEMPIRLTTDND